MRAANSLRQKRNASSNGSPMPCDSLFISKAHASAHLEKQAQLLPSLVPQVVVGVQVVVQVEHAQRERVRGQLRNGRRGDRLLVGRGGSILWTQVPVYQCQDMCC